MTQLESDQVSLLVLLLKPPCFLFILVAYLKFRLILWFLRYSSLFFWCLFLLDWSSSLFDLRLLKFTRFLFYFISITFPSCHCSFSFFIPFAVPSVELVFIFHWDLVWYVLYVNCLIRFFVSTIIRDNCYLCDNRWMGCNCSISWWFTLHTGICWRCNLFFVGRS